VQSVYLALTAFEKNVAFKDLLRGEYLGSRTGSTIGELARAVQDNGLYAQPVSQMSCSMLSRVTWPVILHTRHDIGSPDYNHWVLYMGSSGGYAKIYDGSHTPVWIEWHQLASKWNGVGLWISDDRRRFLYLMADSWISFLIYICLGLCVVVVLALVEMKIQSNVDRSVYAKLSASWFRTSLEATAIFAGSLVCAYAYSRISLGGFLSFDPGVSATQDYHISRWLPSIDADNLAKRLFKEKFAIIDARSRADFDAGHIPGALNLPVDMPLLDRERVLASIARDSRLVIYCQSDGCPYSGVTAQRLSRLGYTDLTLLRGGWVQWVDSMANPSH
jgi:rhodanese-related sulfurtransferase